MIVKYTYQLEFEVWEPLKEKVDKEIVALIEMAKRTLDHAGKVRMVQVKEERLDGNK